MEAGYYWGGFFGIAVNIKNEQRKNRNGGIAPAVSFTNQCKIYEKEGLTFAQNDVLISRHGHLRRQRY